MNIFINQILCIYIIYKKICVFKFIPIEKFRLYVFKIYKNYDDIIKNFIYVSDKIKNTVDIKNILLKTNPYFYKF